jgi:hypothetical protein
MLTSGWYTNLTSPNSRHGFATLLAPCLQYRNLGRGFGQLSSHPSWLTLPSRYERVSSLDAFSRHATLPSPFRGLRAITGKDKPGVYRIGQRSWCTSFTLLLSFLMLRSSALVVLSFRTCYAGSIAPRVSCADNGQILLANSKSLSFSSLIFGQAQERLD